MRRWDSTLIAFNVDWLNVGIDGIAQPVSKVSAARTANTRPTRSRMKVIPAPA